MNNFQKSFIRGVNKVSSPAPTYIIDSLYSSAQQTKIKGRWNGSVSDGFNLGVYDEKQRIIDAKNAFLANTSDWRWSNLPALDAQGKVPATGTNSYYSNHKASRMRDAAFFAWVTNDTSLMGTIRDELLAQAAIYTTNFSNPIWVQPDSSSSRYSDDNIVFEAGQLFAKMAMAFIYCESVFSSTQKTTLIDNYLEVNATFLANCANTDIGHCLSGRDVSLNTDPSDYTAINISGTYTKWTYKVNDGYATKYHNNNTLNRRINNRRGFMLRPALMVWFINGNQYLKNSCEMYVKDHLAFTWYSDGSNAELHRTENASANKGLGYVTHNLGFCCLVANLFYRKGDSSLMTYSTSAGDAGTAGGSKSLLWATKEYKKYFDGTYVRYRWEDASAIASDNIMDGRLASGEFLLTDATYCALPLMNYYTGDTALSDQYTRAGSAYTGLAHSTNYANIWGGDESGQNNGNHLSVCMVMASGPLEFWNND